MFIFTVMIVRCWPTFQKWHILSGYGIWVGCLIINKAQVKYFIVTFAILAVEIFIITVAPWFCWAMDLPFRAGVTIISEYSLVIFIRWFVVLIFQYAIFSSIIDLFIGLIFRILDWLRNLSHNSYQQETQSEENSTPKNIEKRNVGRPRKNQMIGMRGKYWKYLRKLDHIKVAFVQYSTTKRIIPFAITFPLVIQ